MKSSKQEKKSTNDFTGSINDFIGFFNDSIIQISVYLDCTRNPVVQVIAVSLSIEFYIHEEQSPQS